MPRNYNRTLDLAQGQYFKWAAHDDVLEPTYLERCVGVLESDPSVILCHTRTALIDDQGNPIEVPKNGNGRISLDDGREILVGVDPSERQLDSPNPVDRFRAIVLDTSMVYEIFGVTRINAFIDAGKQESFYGTDKVLLSELSVKGRIVILPEPLFLNRRHPTQSVRKTAKEREQWHEPLAVRHNVSPRWLCFKGYMRAVVRNPMSLQDRLGCSWGLVHYAIDWQRWRKMVDEMRRGK